MNLEESYHRHFCTTCPRQSSVSDMLPDGVLCSCIPIFTQEAPEEPVWNLRCCPAAYTPKPQSGPSTPKALEEALPWLRRPILAAWPPGIHRKGLWMVTTIVVPLPSRAIVLYTSIHVKTIWAFIQAISSQSDLSHRGVCRVQRPFFYVLCA